MKIKKLLTLFFLFLLSHYSFNVIAQEKKEFLQHRYDGFIEIINKNYNNAKLITLKNDFARIGVDFNFSKLIINKKNEITRITLKIKNKKSSASLILNKNNGAIPPVKIGETNGIVLIKPVTKLPIKESLKIGSY